MRHLAGLPVARTGLPALICCLLLAPSAFARTDIDLVVEGDHVVTMDSEQRVIPAGAVAVNNGEIIEVGPAALINSRYRGREHLSGRGRVVMPGLINGHAHWTNTYFRFLVNFNLMRSQSLQCWPFEPTLPGYPAKTALQVCHRPESIMSWFRFGLS